MSDLFISEILILSLLYLVLLRPFFRRLQRVEGISFLPLASFLLCIAVIGGLGLRISFLPVFLLTTLLFLSGLSRLFRLFLHLPTDWFSPVSTGYTCVLLLLSIGVVFASWLYAPEDPYFSETAVHRSVLAQKAAPGVEARYTITAPVQTSDTSALSPVVIITGDAACGSGSRNTTTWILAENGFIVVEADFHSTRDYRNPLLSFRIFRNFIFLAGKITTGTWILSDYEEIAQVQEKELSRIVQFVLKEYGSATPLFVVSEGTGGKALLSKLRDNPHQFSGSVLIGSGPSTALSSYSGSYVRLSIDSGMMPAQAGTVPLMVLDGDSSRFSGHGELAADDVLAAELLGEKRDEDRKLAEVTGRRIASWISLRSMYDIR
jgi:hypothetical protein